MIPVDIPVMRGDEAISVTLESDTDDPAEIYRRAIFSDGCVTLAGVTMPIRTHLLRPRDRYPEPPAWDGMPIHDDGYLRIVAKTDGIAIAIAVVDEDGCFTADEDLGVDVSWADLLAAMRKIGALA